MNNVLNFPDSEFLVPVYSPQERTLKIEMQLWNEERKTIIFYETIAFCFLCYSDFTGLRIADNDSQFLAQSLKFEYDIVPFNHDYSCYELVDLDNAPFIFIVATKFDIV